jgi:YVTN family beta-propeller protein
MAVTPDGRTVYVTNDDAGTVTPISTATNTAGPPIVVGKYANSIAIIP